MGSRRLLTQEQDQFLRENMKGRGNKELLELINKKFNLSLTLSQIKSYKKNRNLSSGLTGRFEIGSVPFNKGKKFPGRTNRTCFKKRESPHNTLSVGSEIVDGEGYVRVKIAEPNNWRVKHHILWEERNGPIPENHVVVFADQNRLNFDLENLILISRSELAICNKKKFLGPNSDISRAGVLVSRVIVQMGKRRVKTKKARQEAKK